MSKKMLVLSLVVTLILVIPACKKKAPGQLSSDAMLAMVPDGPIMLMALNFQQFAALNLFDKMIKEDWQKNPKVSKDYKDYKDFVDKTGVDLQKDVYSIVGAIYGDFDSKNSEGVGIVNMKYDRDKLLAAIKRDQNLSIAEKYRGLDMYILKDENAKKDMRLAFLNKSIIVFGTPLQVKKTIDLNLDKGKNVQQDTNLMKYVGKLKKDSMFWIAIGNIPDKIKNAPAGGMMPVDLSKAEAFIGYLDYKSRIFSGEFQLLSHNEQGNKQVVDMLNGLKALGAMGSTKKPELGQLLNAIQLSSTADAIKLAFSLPEELMNKLSDKAQDKAKSMIPPASAGQSAQ